MVQTAWIHWWMSSPWILFIFYEELDIQPRSAWWIWPRKLTVESLLNLHNHDLTSTLCKWVCPALKTSLVKKSDNTVRQSSADKIFYFIAYWSLQMVSETHFSVLFGCDMRKFVTLLPYWKPKPKRGPAQPAACHPPTGASGGCSGCMQMCSCQGLCFCTTTLL